MTHSSPGLCNLACDELAGIRLALRTQVAYCCIWRWLLWRCYVQMAVHSFTHSLIRSLIHSSTHAVIHPFIHSLYKGHAGSEASSKSSKRHEQSRAAPPTASGADQPLHQNLPMQLSHDDTEAVTLAAAPSAGRNADCTLQEVTTPAASLRGMLTNVLTWQAACDSAEPVISKVLSQIVYLWLHCYRTSICSCILKRPEIVVLQKFS